MLTQTVHGDIRGNWDTLPGFVQNSSIFQLIFQGSQITNDQYDTTMNDFRQRMKALSEKAAKRDAGWNSMMWSTFIFNDPSTQMSFFSLATPGYLYRGTLPPTLLLMKYTDDMSLSVLCPLSSVLCPLPVHKQDTFRWVWFPLLLLDHV